ncbi:glycosyltransferase involved in cell wall biosynthesis [Neorhizobium huautlense]|uniref:Glycosyltransferase involved in cell wall biosynthesis n=1 Tax=Neorhizobium huautlense TaxID=67774 RepID=A0ABT9PLS4_9HYPH|nr:glycosyltransferase family 4 protein [Neorhizobium huautlense]MDP9835402.1 glycosyltransferase involved in cell wall biosynthesis [Neorhizobium huautlense]
MPEKPVADRPLNILVATPAGGLGQGGIDRIMAALKGVLERQGGQDMRVRFLATRGRGSIVFAWMHLLRFCLAIFFGRMRGELDLVHVNLASRGSTYRKLVIAACARLVGVPYLLHLHGAEYRSFWSTRDSILNRAIRNMFSKAAGIIVLGSPWKAFVAERVPEAASRVVIVANAVEPPRLPHVGGGEKVHILFLGRIEDRKGVPQLVKALTAMRGKDGWRATIAGDGAVTELRREIDDLGLADRVDVPGWLGPDDVARLLSISDILTLPSFAENLPMSVIEAMAYGLAVVVTPVGAVEDIIRHEETGLLVPPGDDRALSAALLRMVEDADLRQRLGVAGRVFQQKHLTIEPYAEQIRLVWKEAAHRGGETG